jgi:signal transduction histidine kinase
MGGETETFFAPAERAKPEQVAQDVAFLASSPFVDALLQAAGGLLAVLNQERQVLVVNAALLRMLGVDDPEGLVGLRPGEVIGCDHAFAPPSGCGTTRYCQSCGAVVSILGALSTEDDTERKCSLTVVRGGQSLDLCLRVRARILRLDGRRYVMLFLQDATTQERMSEVQRTFFHDLRNLFHGLDGTVQLLDLCDDSERADLLRNIVKITGRLGAEVNLQQTLASDGGSMPMGSRRPLNAAEVISDLASMVGNHKVAAHRHLEALPPAEPMMVVADTVLLGRVLLNMAINAFEASEPGGTVRVWAERRSAGTMSKVRFCVWNATVMPEEIKLRIFQRHFSTKANWGRGVGTWSIKLIGEQFLQGNVGFESELGAGTTFYLELPESPVG